METPIITKRFFNRIRKFFPVQRGSKRVDDRLLISGILWVIMRAAHWRELPEIYGNWSTAYSRFTRWSRKGIFRNILSMLSSRTGKSNMAMLDYTYVKTHRTAASLKADKLARELGRSRGGLTTKIHLLCNKERHPLDFILSSGQTNDIKAAPKIIARNYFRIKYLIADKAYDSDAFRNLLRSYNINDCIPAKSNRKNPSRHDLAMYKKRHVIANMFSSLKDWRGIATRYCRNAHAFDSFVCMALIAIFFNAYRP